MTRTPADDLFFEANFVAQFEARFREGVAPYPTPIQQDGLFALVVRDQKAEGSGPLSRVCY